MPFLTNNLPISTIKPTFNLLPPKSNFHSPFITKYHHHHNIHQILHKHIFPFINHNPNPLLISFSSSFLVGTLVGSHIHPHMQPNNPPNPPHHDQPPPPPPPPPINPQPPPPPPPWQQSAMVLAPPRHYQPHNPPPMLPMGAPPQFYQLPPGTVAAAAPPSPAPNHLYPDHERDWSTGLFQCTSNMKNCFVTTLCPCVTFGEIAEILTEGHTPWYEPAALCACLGAASFVFIFLLWLTFPYTCLYRVKMRRKYKLKGSLIEDCAINAFCGWCALCQQYRELDHQGFNVSIGWHENKRRERQAVAIFRLVPPEEQEMTR